MKTSVYLMIISIAGILLFSACGNKKGDYDASGIFETTEIIVSAKASGEIVQLNFIEGDLLELLSPVGYIDTTQLSLKKKQLEASMNSIGSRRSTISRQVAATEQQIITQKNEQRRFENLVKSNAANQKQLDDIVAQIQILEKQLDAQKETLHNSNNSLSDEGLAMEMQIAQIDDQIRNSIITSPIRGTVLGKYSDEGEYAVPGKALFKVADIETMYLRAYITAGQLTSLKIGQPVKVYADMAESDRKEYAGTITWISDKAEFTPKTIQTRDERANLVYAVKIAVKNDGLIKMGMYGEVQFN